MTMRGQQCQSLKSPQESLSYQSELCMDNAPPAKKITAEFVIPPNTLVIKRYGKYVRLAFNAKKCIAVVVNSCCTYVRK